LIGPLDAAGLEDDEAGAELEDALDAGVVGVVVVDEDEELDDEHPPISSAVTATATPHAAKRVRLSLNMVLSLPFREKGAT
jgi:hypothetical protein